MNQGASITALITAVPAFVREPPLREGETRLQSVIRHNSGSWEILLDRLKERGVADDVLSELRTGEAIETIEPVAMNEIERWANLRLPSLYRTLDSLSNLKKVLGRGSARRLGLELVQILWVREADPSGSMSAEGMATKMGAQVISVETGTDLDVDLARLLPTINGKYLWLVPGGSYFGPVVSVALVRILSHLESSRGAGVYSDGSESLIYRLSALKEVVQTSGKIPANQQEVGRLLRMCGYTISGDSGSDDQLCNFEPIYTPGSSQIKRPAWLERLGGWIDRIRS